jgi:hypothetical protein
VSAPPQNEIGKHILTNGVESHLDALKSMLSDSANESRQWMRTLVELGGWLCAADSLRPITVGVCLPRVEFAALLVATGGCLFAALSPTKNDWRHTWKQLIGKRVAYAYRQQPYVFWEGILCDADQKDAVRMNIQVTESGEVDSPNMEDLHSIKLDPERDGQRLGARIHGKTAFRDARSQKLSVLLPSHAVGEICSWWHQVTLIGKKNRISDELNETLPFRSNGATGCTFADLLRPEGWVADSAILRVLTAQELTLACARGIVVIEASRRLSEHLSATNQHHRVILLGRNEPHYSDSADIVINQFQQREGDFLAPNLECPQHIDLKMFHH